MNYAEYRKQGLSVVELLNKLEGTERVITPLHSPGTAAAVLAAVESPPNVPPEWVDELEQLITERRRPPAHEQFFKE